MNSITDGETVNTTPQLRPMSIGEGVTPDDADSGDAGCAAQERAQQLVAQLNATRRTQQQQTTGFADAAQRFGVDLAHVWMDNGWRPGDEPPKAKIVDDARIGNANELLPAATWIYPPAARQRKREELHRLAANDIGIDLDRPPDWLQVVTGERSQLEKWGRIRERQTSVDWTVRGAYATGVLTGIIAPRKGAKTLKLLNLALSVATGTPWLEYADFDVPRPRPVGLWLRETGEHEGQPKLRMMEEAKLRLLPADQREEFLRRASENINIAWNGRFDLSDATSVHELVSRATDAGIVKARGIVAIDPIKACLGKLAREISNDATIGGEILALQDQLRPATLILCHHSVLDRKRDVAWPSLEDASYGWLANYCRQWDVMDHRIPWNQDTRTFDIRVTIGGSAGQGSRDYRMVLSEGPTPEMQVMLGMGRTGWSAQVQPRRELIAEEARQTAAHERAATNADADRVFNLVRRHDGQVSRNSLKQGEHHTEGFGPAKYNPAVRLLIEQRRIEERDGKFWLVSGDQVTGETGGVE